MNLIRSLLTYVTTGGRRGLNQGGILWLACAQVARAQLRNGDATFPGLSGCGVFVPVIRAYRLLFCTAIVCAALIPT